MSDEIENNRNLIEVWLSVLASLCYCYFIASKIPKGKLRLFSLLPIFYFFTIVPLSLSAVLPTGIAALFFTWLANFKLLLFAFDQGPLSSPPKTLTLAHFIFITCLPVKTKQKQNYPSHQTPKSPQKSTQLHLNWPAKVLLLAMCLTVHDYTSNVHPNITLIQYCCMLYLLVDVIFGFCNHIVRGALGIELEPPSDEPYFSTSLRDFWGKRWNLMVTNTLRHTVYRPVRSYLEPVLGPDWAPLPAVMAAFVVSGLMHELIFCHVTRASPTWEVTWFFVLHGVCLVAEFAIKRWLTGEWRLHPFVSGPLTVGFVVATATCLFFPPITRTGAHVRAIEECKMLMNFLKGKSKLVFGCLNL